VDALLIALRATVDEWLRTRWSDLQFADARTAFLVFVVLAAAAALALFARAVRGRRPGRTHLALPALLPVMRRSPLAMVRHLPVVLFVTGLPFFAVALAGPHTGFTTEEVSYPGRRIALLVDGSTSMVMQFRTERLQTEGEATFFTAVAAAEAFIRRRMDGPYRDLVALIQFGNEAYVVTPFTTDYENILLSIRLISDPREWGRFSDWGTTIIQGIDQATQLFKTFQFVNASGNLMVVFTDGRDSDLRPRGRPLENLVAEARTWKIPVHMVRTAYNRREGEIMQDAIWKDTVERTGGRFYAAYDEESISRALREIDRLAPGRIDVRQYSVQRPRFAGYALAAVALWLTAAVLKLGFGMFRTFP
jgi:Ca-activated chloride channel family protein